MKKTVQGFTLVELLVVIAIVAILAAVVVLIINPLELTRRSRDAARLSDLANLQQAINVALQEGTAAGQASPACNSDVANQTCSGSANNSVTGSRLTNGGGWVAVNFAGQSNVVVPTLPIDPTNTAGGTGYHYTYCGSGANWKIMTHLESAQQKPKITSDGGMDNDPNTGSYEVGSLMTLACSY